MTLAPLRRSYALFRTFLACLFVIFALSCTNDSTDNENDLDVVNPVEDSQDSEDTDESEDSGDTDDSNDSGDSDDSGDTGDSTDSQDDNSDNTDDTDSSCNNVGDFIFVEKDGILKVEFENAEFSQNWQLKTNGNNFSGDGYMSWSAAEYFTQPGNGKVSFRIRIKNPGIYQFLWRSAVTIGNNGTEHNDTWLRFPDADDFFGEKGSSVVYPKGSGKSPHPEGASKNGWLKIYRSGNDLDFKWQALTSDNDPHKVFVTFNSPGIYTMEVSARSKGHAIDQFVLFSEAVPENEATSNATDFSKINCN